MKSPGTLDCPEFRTVPILSHFECNVMSHVDELYTYKPNTYTAFVVVKCFLEAQNAPNPFLARAAGGAYDAPQTS